MLLRGAFADVDLDSPTKHHGPFDDAWSCKVSGNTRLQVGKYILLRKTFPLKATNDTSPSSHWPITPNNISYLSISIWATTNMPVGPTCLPRCSHHAHLPALILGLRDACLFMTLDIKTPAEVSLLFRHH